MSYSGEVGRRKRAHQSPNRAHFYTLPPLEVLPRTPVLGRRVPSAARRQYKPPSAPGWDDSTAARRNPRMHARVCSVCHRGGKGGEGYP